MNFLLRLTLLVLVTIFMLPRASLSFSFSDYEQKEATADQSGQSVSLNTLHCPQSLKKGRIATMIGEIHRDNSGHDGLYGSFISPDSPDWDSRFGTKKSVYGDLVDNLNQGFQQLGLKTYTTGEINAQVAREEQEAFLNNDLDAAVSAADRLSADFMVKGLISTRSQVNSVVQVDEVFVTINLALFDRSGRQISTAHASETTFSDADVLSTIQKLVKAQSTHIIYQLFSDYCKGGK